MKGFGAATYGDRIAEAYDEIYPASPHVEQVTNALAKLAGHSDVLELGIGTGRIALPLAQRGVAVSGIDASGAMVKQLRAKPGGRTIPVTMGDFADFQVAGRFGLVFVVFNTFYALLTQEAQVNCFRCVARHLRAGGVFLIEAFVPDLTRYVRNQYLNVIHVETDRVDLDVARLDMANQHIYTQHLHIGSTDTKLYPVQLRYVWPAELDLMAQLAGMRLRERWHDWDGSPFTSASTKHISIYEHAP